jgi:gliding motility-associated-like protein
MARLAWIVGIFLFFYAESFCQTPTISNIDKQTGTTNTLISITGSNFGTDKNSIKVNLGAAWANVISVTNTLITASVSSGTTFNNVTVTNTATGLSGSYNPFLLSFGGDGFDPSTLTSPGTFAANPGLTEHCLCDFDNNGLVDIVTSTTDVTSNSLSVFRNTSTPAAVSFVKSNLSVSSSTLSVACEDLDGDGKKDLVAAKSGGNGDQLFVLKNTSTAGSITFAASVPFFTEGGFVRKVVIKDLDLDGKPELIASSESENNISIFKNISTVGNINFNFTPIVIPVVGTTGTANLFAEDLNNDGLPEIVANTFLGQLIFLLRNTSTVGNISFSAAISLDIPPGSNQMIATDVNLDGKSDIVSSIYSTGAICVLLNNTIDKATSFTFDNPVTFAVSPGVWGIDAGDADGDGNVDIIAASNDASNTITLLLNNSSGSGLSFARLNIPASQKSKSIKLGDLNNDGKPDISYTGIDNSSLLVLTNKNCVIPAIQGNNSFTICKSTPLQLEVAQGVGLIYQWFKDNSPLAGQTQYFLDVTESGNYKASISESITGCNKESSDTAVKIIDPASPDPQFVITSSGTSICDGDSVLLTIEGDFQEYSWNNGAKTKSIYAKVGGKYIASVKASGGCVATNEITLTVMPSPSISVTASKTVIRKGESVELVASGAMNYLWDADPSINNVAISNPTVTPTTTTTYRVKGQSDNGCLAKAEITIEVEENNLNVNPHKTFSPNGDSYDEFWVIDQIENNPTYKVSIFNRAGQKLFEAQPYTNNWEGIYQGKRLPYGDYYYIIKDPQSGKYKTGSFMLIR